MRYFVSGHLLVVGLASALFLPRDNIPKEISDAFGAVGVETKPYTRPKQYLRTVWSPGDSFTAGIGSNGNSDWYKDSGHMEDNGCSRYAKAWSEQLRDHPGWFDLQGDGYRRNNFGACSGATMQEIMDNQLKQGPNNDEDKFKMIGDGEDAPQVAVLTAGGNDLDFSTIIKACVFGLLWDCEGILKDAESKLADKDKLKAQYHTLYASVLAAGRKASQDADGKGGANPPESFQLFHGTYVPFFNEDTEFCEEVSWSYVPSNPQKFTHERRKKMNDLVRVLNAVIKEAADDYKSWGVFSVDAHVEKFSGHLFCDEVPGSQPIPGWPVIDYNEVYSEHQCIGPWTWFWSLRSPWSHNYEGPDNRPWPHDPYDPENGDSDTRNITSNPDSIPDIGKAIFDRLVPDKGQQDQINNGAKPEDLNEAFKSDGTLSKAIQNMTVKSKDGEVEINLSDGWARVFHPKGSAHQALRDAFFESIKAQRDFGKHDEPPPPAPHPKDLTKALDILAEFVPGLPTLDWQFFATDYGKKIECRSDPVYHEERKRAPGDATMYPGGTFNLTLFDEECQYKNSGDNTGKLFCSDKTIDCINDPADKNPSDVHADKGNYRCGEKWRQSVFTCAY